ncbi:MAG: 6,7-dimethyl-8-ribityllumazine synthase [Candidatus Actinomarina sp.]|tara:strand:- start:126 stop:524 length:399 start_codon:yes stop_codon:yes gene_type:complete
MKNKVAIVYSDYYKEISELLVKGFNKSIDDRFICDAYKVDGSWELIHKINSLSDEYDKFVAIGIIVKGETDHYEYLSSSIANTLLSMTVTKNIYISNCVLNVQSIQQAESRATESKNKGSESAKAINNLFLT